MLLLHYTFKGAWSNQTASGVSILKWLVVVYVKNYGKRHIDHLHNCDTPQEVYKAINDCIIALHHGFKVVKK